MPNKTVNYGLIKPLATEYYDVNIQNGNMDVIDREIKNINDISNKKIAELDSKINDMKVSEFKTDVLKKFENVDRALNEKASKITNVITLKASEWLNNKQTINLATIKATSLLWVTPTPAYLKAYSESMVYAATQINGAITFVCEDIPTLDLDVTIVNGGNV